MTDEINTPENTSETGKEPWRRWTVKPVLEAIFADPPESGIGKRIAYCRGQLDNLSLDALARYTKFFDEEGVSRHSIFRYEAGKAVPGGRELRILCDALWVPAGWLLMGKPDASASTGFGQAVEDALNVHLERMGIGGVYRLAKQLDEGKAKQELERRQQWIDEARKAQPR